MPTDVLRINQHVFLTLQETVSKYKIKIKDGDKEVDEELEVDTDKQTEKLHVPKTDSSTAGEVDIVYDFKKVSKHITYMENTGRESMIAIHLLVIK